MRKRMAFTDTPRVEKVDDGQGDPFYIVYVEKSIWQRYKRRATVAMALSLINVSLLAALLFVTIPTIGR